MSEAGINLRNWEYSPCRVVAEDGVVEENGQVEDIAASATQELRDVTKVLGIRWDKGKDTLACEVPVVEVNEGVTKRRILSYLSKIFGPIGLLCPAALTLKLLLQSVW